MFQIVLLERRSKIISLVSSDLKVRAIIIFDNSKFETLIKEIIALTLPDWHLTLLLLVARCHFGSFLIHLTNLFLVQLPQDVIDLVRDLLKD